MGAFFNILTTFLLIYRAKAEITIGEYYPRYHLAPECGWMNDPNGFSYFKNEFHLFYQYNPLSALEPGTAHWAHAKTKDFVHWEHLPIAMYPNNTYDRNGVFSGSALVEKNEQGKETMYLYYTAHINYADETPDHEETQALAISTDGVNVEKYKGNPIINVSSLQPDFRDPKVWKHGDTYYMVLGNKFQRDGADLGRALLFASKDRISGWKQVAILGESDGRLGYMWECPDFFQLNGRFVLLFSPQGVKPEGDKYKNLYQTGYIVGDFDYNSLKFKPLTEFRELDHGHDFYATQSILDKKGRRIVVAWLDMWETNYPEQQDGFTGQMTVPRVLTLTKDLRLLQRPVSEIRAARSNVARTGPASSGDAVILDDKAGEVNIRASASNDLKLHIEGGDASVLMYFNSTSRQISLDRGGEDGLRRTEWQPKGEVRILIYIDASSIEMFCGNGEVTMSSRFFPNGPVTVRLGNCEVDQLRVINMKRTVFINHCTD